MCCGQVITNEGDPTKSAQAQRVTNPCDPPEGYVTLEYTGRKKGSSEYRIPGTRRAYTAGDNATNKVIAVLESDVTHLIDGYRQFVAYDCEADKE